MTVLQSPPEAEHTTSTMVPEAIIPEARRRGQRRRALWLVSVGIVAGTLVAVTMSLLNGAGAISTRSHPSLMPSARTGSGSGPAVVAWADYTGVVHLGDVSTGRQLQLAASPAPQAGPVTFARGRLLWVDAKDRVRSIEIATGRTRVFARGLSVTPSPDGARLYVDQGTRDFLELNARTLRVIRRMPLPAEWKASPWGDRPVAGGLIVMHTGRQVSLGIWRFGHRVRPLGSAFGLDDVYTAPDGRYSLVSWTPRCTRRAFGSGCPLAIINTATDRTVMVRSPTRWGFTGGAFSPNGTELAIYVNTDNPSNSFSTPRSELAIINTRTGALRLDHKVKLTTTEDAAWATWLPPGRRLLTGAIDATYLVDARTLAARPFYFDGAATRLQSIMSSTDLNFSTIVVPASALSPKQRRSLYRPKAPQRAG